MTIQEAINRVDLVKPNSYPIEEKVAWLSYLDGTIQKEIIDNYENEDAEAFQYTNSNLTQLLIVPFPYDELYISYLKAKIDEANGETARYNNSASSYNTMFEEFAKYYARTHVHREVAHINTRG